MKYICVETSLKKGFVALFSDQKKEFEFPLDEDKHSHRIIQSLGLLKSYCKKNTIQFIAVDRGPGRFTGIRVGVNFAKVLAYYLQIPIFTCSSLELISHPYLKNKGIPVLCLLEAFGNMFYVAAYRKVNDKIQTLIKPSSMYLKDLEQKIKQPFLCVGDVYKEKSHLFSFSTQSFLTEKSFPFIYSQDFSRFVLSKWNSEKLKSWKEIEPLYLRIPGFIKNNVKI